MKVEDETTASSDLSNVVSATTDAPDTTAPSAVTDLRGGPPTTVAQISAPAVDASGELSSQFSDDLATDDDVSTCHCPPPLAGKINTRPPQAKKKSYLPLISGVRHELVAFLVWGEGGSESDKIMVASLMDDP